MAKKKQDPEVVEEVSQDEEFKHEDIAGKSFEEIAVETPPAETPTEAPKEATEESETLAEPVVDVEAEKAKAAAEAKAEALKEIGDKLAAAFKDPNAVEGEPVDEALVSPWAKEKRNPKSYDEIAEWSAELTRVTAERDHKTRADQDAASQETANKAAEEERAVANQYIDTQLDELVAAGKLPKVVSKEAAPDPEQETDAGRRARRNFFQTWASVNQERLAKGQPPVTSPKEIYYEHYQSEEVPGGDAPISGASAPTPSQGSDSFSYAEIHGKGFDQLK